MNHPCNIHGKKAVKQNSGQQLYSCYNQLLAQLQHQGCITFKTNLCIADIQNVQLTVDITLNNVLVWLMIKKWN